MFFCPKYCGIAIVFFIAMIYMAFSVDKCDVSKNFTNSLNEYQLVKYKSIISERRGIYFTGYMLGLLISAVVIFLTFQKLQTLQILCLTGTITFLTAYFYYILSPKQDLIVLQLDTKKQREEWAKVYKTMQFNYHIGLLLGIVAAIMLAKSCKDVDENIVIESSVPETSQI
jgi:hypothetical protein